MPNRPPNGGPPDQAKAIGAAEISRLIERAVRQMPRRILVRGDLINVSRGTCHVFASLREHGVAVRVFIHSRVVARLEAVPGEGTTVVVRASPMWYQPRGDVQLVVEEMWVADEGRGRRDAVARLRFELEREGLLRANRRLRLPRTPRWVTIVGGQGSAAVLDVVNAVHRRSPRTYIDVQPTRLQGPGAERHIAEAIRAAAQSGAEAVAVVRGGGGADDFSPFDTREVCEVIAASPVPIVTALGHEQDRTAADLAAHSSASTPTDAARFLVEDVADVGRELTGARRRLSVGLGAANARVTERAGRQRQSLVIALAGVRERGRLRLRAADIRPRISRLAVEIERQRRIVAALMERLATALHKEKGVRRRTVRELGGDLSRCLNERLQVGTQTFRTLHARLTLAEPEAVVARGFVIATTVAGRPVTSAWDARDLDAMDLQFADGTVRVHIRHTTPEGGAA